MSWQFQNTLHLHIGVLVAAVFFFFFSKVPHVLAQADTSIEGFLQSIGLEKYIITFQAEEVSNSVL